MMKIQLAAALAMLLEKVKLEIDATRRHIPNNGVEIGRFLRKVDAPSGSLGNQSRGDGEYANKTGGEGSLAGAQDGTEEEEVSLGMGRGDRHIRCSWQSHTC